MKQNIAEILKNQGFIENYLVKHDNKKRGTMRIFLKYTDGRYPCHPRLTKNFQTWFGRYVGHEDIPRFYGGLGLSILSTSQGVMAGNGCQIPEDWRRTFVFGMVITPKEFAEHRLSEGELRHVS